MSEPELERWEPPIAGERRAGRHRTPRQGTDLTAALEASGSRILAAFLFIVAGLSRTPPIWLPVTGGLLVLGLILFGGVLPRRSSPEACLLWLADAAWLGLLTPLLLAGTFAGSGAVPLQPRERAVFIQGATASALLVLGVALAIVWWAGRDGELVALGLLPAALLFPAIAGTHDDLRTATVASALALAWLIAAVVTIAARVLGGGLGRLLPFAGYLAFALLALLADRRLAALGAHGLPVALVEPLLLLGAAALLLLPVLLAAPSRRRRARR